MPTISIFYGIAIRMFFGPAEHPPPHFHAIYGEHEAQVAIESGEIIAGKLPQRQLRLVQAWTELHRDELMTNWALLMDEKTPQQIAPLR